MGERNKSIVRLVLEKFYNPTAIDNLLVAVPQAIKLVEDNPGAREWKKRITELRRIERRNGFLAGARGSKRK